MAAAAPLSDMGRASLRSNPVEAVGMIGPLGIAEFCKFTCPLLISNGDLEPV